MNRNKNLKVWQPLLFSLTMIAGVYLGYSMRDNMPGKSFFSIDKSSPLQEVMSLVQNKYVDDVKVNALSDTAIVAILSKLDPHSVFIPAAELQSVNEELAGNFYGIGIEYSILNDTVNVVNVLADGPSAKAGIQIGDKLIKVGDSLIAGTKITSTGIRALLKGDADSKVTVTLLRKGTIKSFTIVRGVIPVSSVDASYIIADSIGYIRLNKFSELTYREFMLSMEALQKQGLKSLILDLRGNGGGVLEQATAIADEFLDGDKLITYTEGVHSPKKEYRCMHPGAFEEGKLIVLADEGTASASEILIGALQDWDRAIIIGRRTFGKGLVQQQYDLSDGSALRLTIARYYTPIGRSIQRPYTDGDKAYYDEISNRFHDGEVLSADSVKNDTTKIFKTIHGKTVYGGGGITPDIFIPLDTSGFSSSVAAIYIKGIISDFAYLYYVQNKDRLNGYKTIAAFDKQFSFTEDDWQSFVTTVAKDSISVSNISPKEKSDIILRIRSSIAREIWHNEGFYETMNTDDDGVKKAIEIVTGRK
ncbi:MAG TPA: S41 family peptidase [Ferruginibacter sp.]|nr:S41 family peptidase [Ferruginibacter sp.]